MIHSPTVPSPVLVCRRFVWPGRLARPGIRLSAAGQETRRAAMAAQTRRARSGIVVLAVLLLAGPTVLAGAGCDRPHGDAAGLRRPAGALSAEALRAATARLTAFGPRGVGEKGHDPAASYVGGRLLLAGCKPILTDTFPCRSRPDGADAGASQRVRCGSVVALAHASPLADAWSRMKGQAEAFTFDHPPRPDLEAALRQAARDEGVSRLPAFDVFKRPSPLFPRAVVRCLLRRLVRDEAGAEDPRAASAVMAGMLRRLARAHEAVLLAAPLVGGSADRGDAHRDDGGATLAVLGAVAEHLVCESSRPRTRTLIVAAVDGPGHGEAGARSLAGMLGPAIDGVSRGGKALRGGSPHPPRRDGSAAVRSGCGSSRISPSAAARAKTDDDDPPPPRRAREGRRVAMPTTDAETPEDAGLARLLGPSAAAARAADLAEALEARPADAVPAAEAEDMLVRLLRLEPYAVRLAVYLDLSGGGRRLDVHLAGTEGEAKSAIRRWLADKVARTRERAGPTMATDIKPLPESASGRATAALAASGREAVLLRTADATRDRPRTADEDTPEQMDVAALAGQARAVAALLEETLAANDLPARD